MILMTDFIAVLVGILSFAVLLGMVWAIDRI
jgi:hypothetical protein